MIVLFAAGRHHTAVISDTYGKFSPPGSPLLHQSEWEETFLTQHGMNSLDMNSYLGRVFVPFTFTIKPTRINIWLYLINPHDVYAANCNTTTTHIIKIVRAVFQYFISCIWEIVLICLSTEYNTNMRRRIIICKWYM